MALRCERPWLPGLASLAVAALLIQPTTAQAQQMRTSAGGGRLVAGSDYLHPIESDLGMPIGAGEVNIRARAGIPTPGSLGSTVFGLNAGLSDTFTLEFRAPYLVLGGPAGPGYFTGLAASGQVGIYNTPARELGLSLSVGMEAPGGPGGFNLTGVEPLLGLRSRATAGPIQGHLNLYARPLQSSLTWQLAGMWQVTEGLAPGLEFLGTTGIPGSLSIIPEIKVRPIQNLALGFGYQVPLSGAAGQILAQAELLF